MNDDAMPVVQLNLDANAVAAPAHTAAWTCREIVDFYFDAMAKADLSKKPPGLENVFFRFDVRGPDLTAEQRRGLYESWILARAFQDLMRGVRGSLDQAYLFTEIISRPVHRVKSDSTLDDLAAPFLEAAAKKHFPDLLAVVNSRLEKPLDFAVAYQSLQNARNCLEHRGGVVGRIDVGKNDSLELSFPRIKIFYERHGEEVELEAGVPVNAGDGQAEVQLLRRFDVRQRRFVLGERLALTASDFDEIAFACYYFGSQLATRLPKLVTPMSA
jgi:hypothetical protein